jgi:glycosyltransferase involved in cell wall biosynthesis
VLNAARHPVAPALIGAAKRQPALLYIGHLVGLPAAAIAAAYHGAKYAYDAEDFHPGNLPDTPENSNAIRTISRIEARYLPGCTHMTAASPGIADAYAAKYIIHRPTVILNTFPTTNAPQSSTAAGFTRPGPSIYWFSQTIGHDRGLQSAVRAIALSSCRPHLYLRGECSPQFAEELRKLASENDVEERLHLLPLGAPHQMEELAAAYDVGLCSEIESTTNRRIALTNKQFTYLLAGLPALMSKTPAHHAFAAEANGAVALFEVDDAWSLAKAIDRVLADPHRLADMRAAAWKLGQTRYNWQTDAKRLVELVRLSVKPSKATACRSIRASS